MRDCTDCRFLKMPLLRASAFRYMPLSWVEKLPQSYRNTTQCLRNKRQSCQGYRRANRTRANVKTARMPLVRYSETTSPPTAHASTFRDVKMQPSCEGLKNLLPRTPSASDIPSRPLTGASAAIDLGLASSPPGSPVSGEKLDSRETRHDED